MTITDAPVQPRWPTRPFDPARASLFYNPLADELVLYFEDRTSLHYVDFIEAPSLDVAAILVGLDEHGEETGEIVGVQVDLLAARAAKVRTAWRALADPHPPSSAMSGLVGDIRELFARYWTPPIDEEWRTARATKPRRRPRGGGC